ncbi:hypothetical protein AB0B25_12050 [Nocardia sp. NPDC049190]|uniref:hypothetical protein n=1 Tax=Nocardia sp. NPDC049190 TaxID=3155650 RepID=UPI0033F80BF2
MIPHPAREQIDLWASASRDCTLGIIIEGQDHARYLLSAHTGHGPCCQPYQDALSAVSVAMG